jgi:hypothetical protein
VGSLCQRERALRGGGEGSADRQVPAVRGRKRGTRRLQLGNREELGRAWRLGCGGKRPAEWVEKEKGCGWAGFSFPFLLFFFKLTQFYLNSNEI